MAFLGGFGLDVVEVGQYWDNSTWSWAPILASRWPPVDKGLSSPHIFPQQSPQQGSDAENDARQDWVDQHYLPDEQETYRPDRAAYAEFYKGGSLATVKRVSSGSRKGENWIGGKRSEITTFSWASRRRLMQMVAKLRRDTLPLFVTLTYPDEFPDDPLRWKRDLKAFWQRLHRRFPCAGFVWRQDTIDRKSGQNKGEIAPHYHILLYGVKDHPGLRDWVSQSWYEVVASDDPKHLQSGTQVAHVKSHRGVLSYASKIMAVEMAKQTQTKYRGCGRWWGCYGRQFLPWAIRVWFPIADGDAVRYIRWLRRHARLQYTRAYKSLTVFCNGARWLEAIRAGPDPPGSYAGWVTQLSR